MGSADVILYTKWTSSQTYTVTYDKNTADAGVVPVDSNNYLPGATVTAKNNTGTLTKTGYTFAGWNTKADGTGTDIIALSTFSMGSANVILYAKWTAVSPSDESTITYDANGGIGTVPYYCDTYLCDDKVIVLKNTTLTKAGYAFAGWNTQADGKGTDVAPDSTYTIVCPCDVTFVNVILYAKWTANTPYTVTYNRNGGKGALPTDDNTYLTGDTVTVKTKGALIKVGYSFNGWNTEADGTGTFRAPKSTFVMGSANVILYAQWKRVETPSDITGDAPVDKND